MKKTALLAALLPQIQELKEFGLDKVRSDNATFAMFRTVYHSAFGIYPSNCSSCPVEKQFNMLMDVSDEQSLETLLNRRYKLKDNDTISIGPDDYNNSNLTDEKAVELLHKYPGLHSRFQILPEDWEEEAADFEEKKAEDETPKIRVVMPDGKNRTRKIAIGDLALVGDEPAEDGEYTIKKTTFIVKDGKVETIQE